MKKKAMALVLALGLVTVGIVGGTMAWLTAEATEVKNVFTDSDINITLTETGLNQNNENSYKMIPGHTITKDPVVKVDANSEPCYLFVQVTENLGAWADSNKSFKDYLSYEIADGWTPLAEHSGVYYQKVASPASAPKDGYAVLKDDKVTVSGDVTKEMMDEIDDQGEAKPTLTFQAAAVQLYKTQGAEFTVAEAYAEVVWPAGNS